jgi:hypothetical protein
MKRKTIDEILVTMSNTYTRIEKVRMNEAAS